MIPGLRETLAVIEANKGSDAAEGTSTDITREASEAAGREVVVAIFRFLGDLGAKVVREVRAEREAREREREATPVDDSTVFFKVLQGDQSCHGGTHTWSLPKLLDNGEWEPGEWHEVPEVIHGRSGFHLTALPAVWWTRSGLAAWVAEYEDAAPGDSYKIAVRRVRLLRAATAEELAERRVYLKGIHNIHAEKHETYAFGGRARGYVGGYGSVFATDECHVEVRGQCEVKVRGHAPTGEGKSAIRPTVIATDRVKVTSNGEATISVGDRATVSAVGGASVTSYSESFVHAADGVVVSSYGSSNVRAYGGATVYARGCSNVYAEHGCNVSAFGLAVVRVTGNVKVDATDNATVINQGSVTVAVDRNAVAINRTNTYDPPAVTTARSKE